MSITIGTCAIRGLYSILCRDADTASGGVEPSEVVLHAPGFYKLEGLAALEDLPGDGIDRRIEIRYAGTDGWHTYASSASTTRMRSLDLIVSVGYFAGTHDGETQAIIADDDELLGLAIKTSSSWPKCTTGCVNGYWPLRSTLTYIEANRYILEILVRATVTA